LSKNNTCKCGYFKSQHPIKKELHGNCIFKSCSCKKFVVKEDIKCKDCNGKGYHESYNQVCLCDCIEGEND
jgi:hypothetical protein